MKINYQQIVPCLYIVQFTLFKSCFPMWSLPKDQKGKTQLFPLFYQIFGRPFMKSLWIKFIPSMSALPFWGNQDTQRKRIFISNEKVTNLLTTNATVRNQRGFPQKWRPRDITFVNCGLVYCAPMVVWSKCLLVYSFEMNIDSFSHKVSVVRSQWLFSPVSGVIFVHP